MLVFIDALCSTKEARQGCDELSRSCVSSHKYSRYSQRFEGHLVKHGRTVTPGEIASIQASDWQGFINSIQLYAVIQVLCLS
jgi:hypothetical protein